MTLETDWSTYGIAILPNWQVATGAPDDEQLLKLVKHGSPAQSREAMAKLYETYNRQLWLGMRKSVNSAWDANEIVAETWARVIDKVQDYEFRGKPFVSWLFSIAHNVKLEHLRKMQEVASLDDASEMLAKGAQYLVQQLQDVDQPENQKSGVEPSVQNAADILVSAAVATLPEAEKQIVLLRYFDNCESLKEVAERLNENPSTVRVYHGRALKKIERFLADRGLYREINDD